jgi:hypothetical protein
MLAMVANDEVGRLDAHVVRAFFVGAPPGACPLLQVQVQIQFTAH